jgi:20S proteasome alpha/beta subunit
MAWKSTIDITRDEAIQLVIKAMAKVHTMSNTELEDFLEVLGYGETIGMEYFGNNFRINN